MPDLSTPFGAILVAAPLLVAGIFVLIVFNRLVGARQRVRQSWSGVDVELARRHDLVPNLVETVRGIMGHERQLLEEVTRLRGEAERARPGVPTDGQLAVERQLESALGRLVARFEAYPELRSQGNFAALQAELAHTEDRIAAALRYYNGNVRDLNVLVESFPSNLIAGVFSFARATYFQLDEAARRAPSVDLGSRS